MDKEKKTLWLVRHVHILLDGKSLSTEKPYPVFATDKADALNKVRAELKREGFTPTLIFEKCQAEEIKIIGPTELELCEVCVCNGRIVISISDDESTP